MWELRVGGAAQAMGAAVLFAVVSGAGVAEADWVEETQTPFRKWLKLYGAFMTYRPRQEWADNPEKLDFSMV